MKSMYFFWVLVLSSGIINCSSVQLDTSFGPSRNGTVVTTVGSQAQANAMLLQPDGKIILVGDGYTNSAQYIFLVRYLSTGDLDVSFGTDGIVTTTFKDGLLAKNSILLADGKILVSGAFIDANGPQFAGIRYLSDGTLDPSWGDGGINCCSVYGVIESIAPTNDNKMVCGGITAMDEKMAGAGCRRLADGTLDPTFGPGQGTIATVVGLSTQVHEVVVQPDEKILMAGVANLNGDKFLCMRYNDTGILDDTFGSGGIVTTAFPETSFSHAYSLALQSDGKIILIGEADHQCCLARYESNGSLDQNFGSNGLVQTVAGASSVFYSVIIQSDGKIVCVGQSDESILLIRYNDDGTLDTTFGVNGIITTTIGADGQAQDVIIQADGKIVIGGGANGKFVIARYRASNANFITIEAPENGATIASNTFTMTGSSSQSALQYRLKLDGTTIITALTDNVGSWDAGTSPIVANGQHTLVADLLTASGDVLTSTSNTFTVNALSDSITINQPIAGAVINTNKPLVTGSASRSSALVILILDGTAWTSTMTDNIGNWQTTLGAIPNGNHELKAALLVDNIQIAQALCTFTASQYFCDNLRVLGGMFTTGNPPVINGGSGSSCPPTCDFSVVKIAHNKFNVTYGYPFSYPPLVSGSAEKIRSTSDGFITIVEGGTVGYVIVELHGKASQIHFFASSCRG